MYGVVECRWLNPGAPSSLSRIDTVRRDPNSWYGRTNYSLGRVGSQHLPPLTCCRLSADAPPAREPSPTIWQMNSIRLRHVIAVASVLLALAILGAPTAVAKPVDCVTDPANAACPNTPGVTPTSPNVPLSPYDPECIAEAYNLTPGDVLCAFGPWWGGG